MNILLFQQDTSGKKVLGTTRGFFKQSVQGFDRRRKSDTYRLKNFTAYPLTLASDGKTLSTFFNFNLFQSFGTGPEPLNALSF
ncbi:hypothetical protein [uncultured Desulfobacter sp.]|uniref:hypothetical protein n=1 Tax=uncultured Desulfobacter sp. TaxID=240139 RepID=UPI0029F5B62F|nr:hypothetical protein [uncultured Desulfobacter sp.]